MRGVFVGLLVVVVVVTLSVVVVDAQNSSSSPSGKRTLVLTQSPDQKATYSSFFKSLEGRGHKLVFASAESDTVKLHRYGDYSYDQVILFAPNVENLGSGVGVEALLKFIDDGRDVLIVANSKLSGPVRDLAVELGVEFADDGTSIIDHLNFDSSDFNGAHDLLAVSKVVNDLVPVIVSAQPKSPILFKGVGATLTESNSLVFPILVGSSSAYSAKPEQILSKIPAAVGSKSVLVSGIQARNNARVVISGSIELFSNKFFDSPVSVYGSDKKFAKSGNQEFVDEIIQWIFKDKAVLSVGPFAHHKLDGPEGVYRIRDDVEFTVNIKEWKNGAWVPFKSNDVQLEFVRVDPFIRAALKAGPTGDFSTIFKVPDVYGVFTFKLVHGTKGYTFIHDKETVKVRPFRHNEYERFIPAAYPYYASALSMMTAFTIFSFVFLYHK